MAGRGAQSGSRRRRVRTPRACGMSLAARGGMSLAARRRHEQETGVMRVAGHG
jgi:hypothetical protein